MNSNPTLSTPNATESLGTSARLWVEWGVALFSTWFVTGLYLDGWAHANELPDSFFTPWHAVLYSGFLGAAIVLVSASVSARLRGATLKEVLPAGYGLSLLGAGLFLIGGIGDMLWHIFFGIEAKVAAFYSPSHLVLAAAGILIASGAWRFAWTRPTTSQRSRWLAVLSLTLVLSILTFFTSEMNPFDHPWAWMGFRPGEIPFVPSQVERTPAALLAAGGTSQDIAEALGISSILLQSSILMALLLLLIRREGARLPFGWLTFVLFINALGMSIFHSTPWTIPVAAIAGIMADVLYRWLQPGMLRPLQLRLFATIVPVVLYSLYFLAVQIVGGIWWPIHLWTGGIVLAGVAGWGVGYLIVPPGVKDASPERGA